MARGGRGPALSVGVAILMALSACSGQEESATPTAVSELRSSVATETDAAAPDSNGAKILADSKPSPGAAGNAGASNNGAGENGSRSAGGDKSAPLSFASPVDLAAGSVNGVSALDAGDLDGDGRPDVVVADGGKHANGGVTFAWFQSPERYGSNTWRRIDLPLPDSLTSADPTDFIGEVKVADMDGDSDLDIVVAMDHHSGGGGDAFLYILENPGGSIATSAEAWRVRNVAELAEVYHINDMEIVDLDEDGRLDIVVRSLEPNRLFLFFQDRDSAWMRRAIDTSTVSSGLADGEGFAIGDLDRSNGPDISINGFWMAGPPNPRIDPFEVRAVDARYASINANTKEAIGDINGDGRADLVISPAEGYRSGANHVLAWYEAPPNPLEGEWKQHVLATDYNGGHSADLADLDGDGDLDLVTSVSWNEWGQTKRIEVRYWERAAATFSEPQVVWSGHGLYSAAVVDIGADGDLDLVGQQEYSNSAKPMLYQNLTG